MNGKQSARAVTADSLVQDLVGQHPQVIGIFGRYGLRCVGCYISPFHTIADTAREYGMAIDLLLADLNRAVAGEPG